MNKKKLHVETSKWRQGQEHMMEMMVKEERIVGTEAVPGNGRRIGNGNQGRPHCFLVL